MNNFNKFSAMPRHPRTLEQAFGPYTSHEICEDKAPSDGDITISLVCGVIFSMVLVGIWMGWLG